MPQLHLPGQGPTFRLFQNGLRSFRRRHGVGLLREWFASVAVILLVSHHFNFFIESASGQSFSPTSQWHDDANLNDVFFLDANLGWAVGDRGTILRTEDGGRSWAKANSPVECTLESVCFIDADSGWAVGGYARPITHLVSGVVLKTMDGGQTWRRVAAESIPWMHRIVMETESRGWALVTRSAWAPSGIVLTDNGGLTWRPFAGNVEGEWTSAARLAPDVFAVVGRDKTAGLSRRGDLEEAFVVNPGRFDLTSMTMVDAQYGWAVGTSGTVAMTRDGGYTWDLPDSPRAAPEGRISRHFDWQTVVALGNDVWIAGSPGTRIAHSQDQGRTWDWIETGTSLPIRRLFFWNERRGWGVGDGGVVIATMDGGQSWRVVREPVSRVAILGIFDSLEDVPLELLARYAGNDGYYTSIAMTGVSPLAGIYDSPARDRLRQALSDVGVSGLSWARLNAYAAPLPQTAAASFENPEIVAPRSPEHLPSSPAKLSSWGDPSESTAAGNSMIAGESRQEAIPSAVSREQLKEYLVRLVRQWRPDVIVSDALEHAEPGDRPDAMGGTRHATITHQLLSEVFADAADANAFPEQLKEAGLQVWAPAKLYLKGARETRVDEMLATNQFSPRLGTSLEDYCLAQNGLLKSPELDPEIRPGWVLHASTLANAKAHRSFLSGLGQQSLRDVQRPLAPPGPGNLGVMQRQARKWEWIERVMVTTYSSKGDPAIWQREVDRLLIGLDETGKGNALFQVALEHEGRGQYEAAARAMHQLVTDCEQHPFWDAAMIWLVRYYASGEAQWRLDPDARVPHIQLATFDEAAGEGVDLAGRTVEELVKDPVQVPYSLQQMIRDRRFGEISAQNRSGHARKLWQSLQARRSLVAELAPMHVAMSALNRRMSGVQEVRTEVITATRYADRDWQRVSQIEDWLREGKDAPPIPVIICNATTTPPTLDGVLDDPLWQMTPEISLALLNGPWQGTPSPTLLKVARDNEFLYLAFECAVSEPIQPLTNKAPKANPAASDEDADATMRRRDQDLTDFDRVWMAIDVDRDYATAYSFEIDVHGRPRDTALEDTDWDPQWFVAHRHHRQGWTLEIAVPFSQLQDVPPRDREAWGISVRRLKAGERSPVASPPLFASPRPTSLLLFDE